MQPIRVSIVEREIEQPIGSREISKFCARSMRRLSLVGTQQGYPKERIKNILKIFHSGYRDLKIGIKAGYPFQEFLTQFW